MTKDRMQEKIGPEWDPLGQANECIGRLRKAIDDCNALDAMAFTGCAYGNAEAAFYEKVINEDDMVSIKDTADNLRQEFSRKCKCEQRK